MLINREDSLLLVVDVQERLLPAIHDWQRLLDRVMWLVQIAKRLDVPVLATEQYPRGLGPTHAELRALLESGCISEKLHFSCVAAGICKFPLASTRRQIVVCGIESHVCVLQTVVELREQGKEVFVVADAVSSRDRDDKALALARMRQSGAEVVSGEMVAFEWLKQAGTPLFKEISMQFLR